MAKYVTSYVVWFHFSNLRNFLIKLPGQGWVLHSIVSTQLPIHNLPPYLGGGFVHDRVRSFNPVAHDLEQLLKLPKAVHFPSTLCKRKTSNKSSISITIILSLQSVQVEPIVNVVIALSIRCGDLFWEMGLRTWDLKEKSTKTEVWERIYGADTGVWKY